jgi:hypothetical protein
MRRDMPISRSVAEDPISVLGVEQIVLRFALPHDEVVTVDRISVHWRTFSELLLPFCRAL